MRIRVNADDLGLNARVNDETFALIARGLVQSASVLVNAPESADAIERAKQHPECGFGVHLNVSQFGPLRPTDGLAPVLNGDGRFVFNVLWQIRKTRSLRRAVYLEWSAQVRRFIDLGLHPAHLDSHHDVHMIPEFFVVLKRLQWKFGIRRVRRRSNIPSGSRKIRNLLRDEFWAATAKISGSETADYVGGLNDFRRAVELGEWNARHCAKAPQLELIIHPGNDFDPVFRQETEMLEEGWLHRVVDYQHMVDGSRAVAGSATDRPVPASRWSPKQPV